MGRECAPDGLQRRPRLDQPLPGRFGYGSAPRGEMYRDVELGWRLPLAGGEDGPVAEPIEKGCISQAAACDWVGLDRLGPDAWILAQGGGTTAAVLSDTGAVRHRFDVRSPRFRRDGSALTWEDDIDAEFDWDRGNSRIYGIYAHDGVVATVHGHITSEGSRNPEFAIYMNLHTAAGEGLVSDLLLPDQPVGFDDGHLLAVDYGEAGCWGGTDGSTCCGFPSTPPRRAERRRRGARQICGQACAGGSSLPEVLSKRPLSARSRPHFSARPTATIFLSCTRVVVRMSRRSGRMRALGVPAMASRAARRTTRLRLAGPRFRQSATRLVRAAPAR